jgi:hypothetical protein
MDSFIIGKPDVQKWRFGADIAGSLIDESLEQDNDIVPQTYSL